MGLFGRAKAMLNGSSLASAGKSQFYHVACSEGHVLHGQRTDGYQALRCPTCGEGIFVLPRSPLPEPVAPASAQGRRPATRTSLGEDNLVLADPPSAAETAQARSQIAPIRLEEDEAQIEWVDEAESDASPPQVGYNPETSIEPEAPATRPKPVRAKPRPTPVAAPSPIPKGMIEVEDRPTFGEWVWKRRNGMIFLTVAVIVVATIGLGLRQRHLATLPAIVEIGRTEGLAKLDAGEFQVAKQLLVEAASAVKSLGGQVDGADAIRQGAREAALFADRVGERLETLVESAAKAESESAWTSRFDTLYKGQSILIEDQISAVPDPSDPESSYQISYVILYGGNLTPAGRGRIDLAGFRLFELEKPKKGESKIFGARLASMRFDKGKGEWLIGLIPDSGSFITHDKAWKAVTGLTNLPEDDQ